MKRNNKMITVIIIMLLIVSLNVIINYPKVSAGRWRYNSTIENIYNVTISSDDAVAIIGSHFDSTGETITLKANIYQSIIGLRFDNISVPFNATHQYFIASAYISLWSDYVPLSYESESGGITLYCERGNDDVQTFSNYTDLTTRTPSFNYRNWDLDNVHGDREAGRWNDGPNMNTMITDALDFDNDTVAIIINSARGVWYRDFRTIDHFVDYAPRLHLILELYLWEETAPSGYDDYVYVETYRDFDIWYMNESNWLQFDEFSGPNTGALQDINATYTFVSVLNEDEDTRQAKPFTESGWIERNVLVNVTHYHDSNGVISSATWLIWGLGESDDYHRYVPSEDFDCYSLYVDGEVNGNTYRLMWVCKEGTNSGGGGWTIWNETYRGASEEKTIQIQLNPTTGQYRCWVWDDINRTSLWRSKTDGQFTGYVPDEPMTYEHVNSAVFGGSSPSNDWTTGFVRSKINKQEFVITDEEGNIIDTVNEDATIEDVRVWIDNYLGASSEYDKSPWMGDFTLLLVGLVGIAFIPLGFLIFVSSVRDGDIIGGLQTLVLMFFIGIGCIVTWLWA